MGLLDRPNKVPEYQRLYQSAYRSHQRLWRIHPRSSMMLTPYTILLWGTAAATMYAMGRRILGHNTWFSD
ncbi:6fe34c0b-8e16-494e-b45c-330c9f0ed4c6 [Thermothielavioides terrestris]|uniref:Cytochrome c oxidase subunit 7 n=2 Tax=Thermothielavioides terrestris TaxID=2587410 RepID=G2QQR1_THETT|nr:uncharacterized protein THITE_2108294 [Thermothielavioides terrestris NRRL 8126]AEO63271.1 hypothetical protein THITE_2108294 [Thermothielavioides terrestris NRRL 8126]SPQ21239.1 6fe34c0b-8e16-494e-b45c-330c9f0ed4c6 [Thermothielavioides terrestris]